MPSYARQHFDPVISISRISLLPNIHKLLAQFFPVFVLFMLFFLLQGIGVSFVWRAYTHLCVSLVGKAVLVVVLVACAHWEGERAHVYHEGKSLQSTMMLCARAAAQPVGVDDQKEGVYGHIK